MQMKFDTARHGEIIVKGISAILLLLLKHAKANRVYTSTTFSSSRTRSKTYLFCPSDESQFERVCEVLADNNCIPLILNYMKQDTQQYIDTDNTVHSLELFPTPKRKYSWRNMFATINLLRVLHKLTAGHSLRIRSMVQCKAPVSDPLREGVTY
jgi:hypothetical protein